MMLRQAHIALIALATAAALTAQVPAGWKMRVDRSASAADPDGTGPMTFTTSGAGFHAVNPRASVYWKPSNTAAGNYTLKATFILNKPSGHTNYYGLVFGGSDLEGAAQKYVYFVVAQDGTWLIKSRDGNNTDNVSQKTPNDAVKKPDATGMSTNALEVRVGASKVDFVVNGTVVTSLPKTGALAKTDGIYGIRINHLLDVQIDGLAVSK